MRLAFVQPFGIGSPGGGPRILRALLKDAPVEWKSFTTGVRPPPAPFGVEDHLPSRPNLGRLEQTRLHKFLRKLNPFFEGNFELRLESACRKFAATGLHSIPCGADFAASWRVARRLGLSFHLYIHDDQFATPGRHILGPRAMNIFPEIWRNADSRFVISEALGREYCSRYGERVYEIVTDGVETLGSLQTGIPNRLNIYFMGLFHNRYEPNLACLAEAVEILQRNHPELRAGIRLRCGTMRRDFRLLKISIQTMPFGKESDVTNDLAEADLLYLPLPFEPEHEFFVRFSLSTKMVTYLGSGIPILFHGPENSAAYGLLSNAGAAFAFASLDAKGLERLLARVVGQPELGRQTALNALELARAQFLLSSQRSRFWERIRTVETPTMPREMRVKI